IIESGTTRTLEPTATMVNAETAFAGVSYQRLQELPTDPNVLEARLTGLLANRDEREPEVLLDALIEPFAPPAVRTGLVRALAARGLAPVAGPDAPAGAFTFAEGSVSWTVVFDG